MARTHQKHYRVYCDGVDISGYSRTIGALNWSFDAEPDAAITDGVKNVLIGRGDIGIGGINTFADNDAAGAYALLKAATGTRNILVAMGANAAPVAGNPIFAWQFEQVSYQVEQGSGFVAASLALGGASYASTLAYEKPWGVLLHSSSAATGANTATGIDDNGAATALGGIFIWHLLSSDGTCTLTAQDAATNSDGSFAALTGATSGSITAAVTPQSGMVALGTTATVRRYLRWQITLGTATTATFVAALIRNNITT